MSSSERLAGEIFGARGRQAVWLVDGLMRERAPRRRGKPLPIRPSRSSLIRLDLAQ